MAPWAPTVGQHDQLFGGSGLGAGGRGRFQFKGTRSLYFAINMQCFLLKIY